jgi:hypothetical protein
MGLNVLQKKKKILKIADFIAKKKKLENKHSKILLTGLKKKIIIRKELPPQMSDHVDRTEADLATFAPEFTFAGFELKGILLQIAIFLKENEGKTYSLDQLWTLQGLPLTKKKNAQCQATGSEAKYWEKKKKKLINDFFFLNPPPPFFLNESNGTLQTVGYKCENKVGKAFFQAFKVAPDSEEIKTNKIPVKKLREFAKTHSIKGVSKAKQEDLLQKIVKEATAHPEAPASQLVRNGFLNGKILFDEQGEQVWEIRRIVATRVAGKELWFVVQWNDGSIEELHRTELANCPRLKTRFYKKMFEYVVNY